MELLKQNRQLIIAHRGRRDRFPENTLEAFQAAVDDKADMIELDVGFSRDRRLIVIHDDTLDRTTNGSGFVHEQNLSNLKQLDAGSWFSERFSGLRLPELDEVFDLIGGKIAINVEIKARYFENEPDGLPIEQMVWDQILEFKLADSILISSFEIRILRRLSQSNCPIPLGYITENALDEASLNDLHELNAFSWHPWHKVLNKDLVQAAHKKNLRVFPYTVNTIDNLKTVSDIGVDGVFTDFIDTARKTLLNHQK